jgi:hypothetical protein
VQHIEQHIENRVRFRKPGNRSRIVQVHAMLQTAEVGPAGLVQRDDLTVENQMSIAKRFGKVGDLRVSGRNVISAAREEPVCARAEISNGTHAVPFIFKGVLRLIDGQFPGNRKHRIDLRGHRYPRFWSAANRANLCGHEPSPCAVLRDGGIKKCKSGDCTQVARQRALTTLLDVWIQGRNEPNSRMAKHLCALMRPLAFFKKVLGSVWQNVPHSRLGRESWPAEAGMPGATFVISARRDFVGSDEKLLQLGKSESRCQCGVGGVAAVRHQHAPDPPSVVTGIHRPPSTAHEDLEPGAEIHRIR